MGGKGGGGGEEGRRGGGEWKGKCELIWMKKEAEDWGNGAREEYRLEDARGIGEVEWWNDE